MAFALKRVYEEPREEDGTRVLVERLWPRGVSRERARLDLWLKDVAPSTGLRRWYGHDEALWEEFRRRYFRELEAHPEAVATLREAGRRGPVTLVYAARAGERCGAAALKEFLERGG